MQHTSHYILRYVAKLACTSGRVRVFVDAWLLILSQELRHETAMSTLSAPDVAAVPIPTSSAFLPSHLRMHRLAGLLLQYCIHGGTTAAIAQPSDIQRTLKIEPIDLLMSQQRACAITVNGRYNIGRPKRSCQRATADLTEAQGQALRSWLVEGSNVRNQRMQLQPSGRPLRHTGRQSLSRPHITAGRAAAAAAAAAPEAGC
jgi:hypothetical protein